MRASRVLAIVIVVNVLLGVLAAGVVLSPEFAALDRAVREGKKLPAPSPEIVQQVTKTPDWKYEIVTPCRGLCRVRISLIVRFYSDDELLRAYLATR